MLAGITFDQLEELLKPDEIPIDVSDGAYHS
jgi:hypothetical protein